MSELTQLERAQLVAASFEQKYPPGHCYVYIYLGKATYDASAYEVLDGQVLMSKRVWLVDESRIDCVSYVGRGDKRRIDFVRTHPVLPPRQLRVKLIEGLSYEDSIDLERNLISELGCICDHTRSDGCLVNLRYYQSGPMCCDVLEASAYKHRKSSALASAARGADVICFTEDKTLVARGTFHGLGRQLGIPFQNMSKCLQKKARGIWHSPTQRPLYFCYHDQYEDYVVQPMTTKQRQAERLMVAHKLDASDTFCGTATQLSQYDPTIKASEQLHRAARGEYKHSYGWVAYYLDCLEAPIETISATPINYC